MNRVLKLKEKLWKYPFGKYLFSKAIARMAPYFKTIKPQILQLEHGYIKVAMQKRKSVHNHLKTVHAIASCNLCEFAAGICMEASIPNHKRWIPLGMEVEYLKLAKTDLTADCDLKDIEWNTTNQVDCLVSVKDQGGIEVVRAIIHMKVSDKKK